MSFVSLVNLRNFLVVSALITGFSFDMPAHGSESVLTFKTAQTPPYQDPHIAYNLNLQRERFYVWTPPNFSPREQYGLIVYISPDDSARIPAEWATVLADRKFIFVAPQNAGNQQMMNRRTGLASLAALAMMNNYRIDKNRIYAAGLSGGARTACALGFWQPDIFRGTIQACGTDYYRAVSGKGNANAVDSSGRPYGILPSTSSAMAQNARARVKFVLITGAGDFRHANIVDIYNNGYKADGFRSLLIDVPEMGHQDCDARTFSQALRFLSGGN
jgi:hypothetical protein